MTYKDLIVCPHCGTHIKQYAKLINEKITVLEKDIKEENYNTGFELENKCGQIEALTFVLNDILRKVGKEKLEEIQRKISLNENKKAIFERITGNKIKE